MTDLLIKPATLQTVFAHSTGCNGMYPVLLKPQPHPVKTPFRFTELGFVRVERKTKCVQTLFQVPHCTP